MTRSIACISRRMRRQCASMPGREASPRIVLLKSKRLSIRPPQKFSKVPARQALTALFDKFRSRGEVPRIGEESPAFFSSLCWRKKVRTDTPDARRHLTPLHDQKIFIEK